MIRDNKQVAAGVCVCVCASVIAVLNHHYDVFRHCQNLARKKIL